MAYTSAPSAGAPLNRRRPLVLADLIPGAPVADAGSRVSARAVARDAALVFGAAGFVGALSQVVIHLHGTPVPITGQTLGVVLAGCALGWRRGALAMLSYLLLGLAGVPWFESHTSGWQSLDGGYLVGFVAAAAVCGWLAEHGSDRTLLGSIPTMLVGEVVLYLIALPWLAVAAHVDLAKAYSLGCSPFLVGDALKMAIAAGLLPAAWRLVGTTTRRG